MSKTSWPGGAPSRKSSAKDIIVTRKSEAAPDGDMLHVRQALRLVSCDTPESHYPSANSVTAATEKLQVCQERLEQGDFDQMLPESPERLRKYFLKRLTSKAGKEQIEAACKAHGAFELMLKKRLNKGGIKRKLGVLPAGEIIDKSMRRRFNELRANPISAYAPGIPWPVVGKKEAPSRTVDLDGSGTSSATPQAAAAAAHWLAYHKNSIPANEWSTWCKAEAVYTAMVFSALRPWEGKGSRRREDQRPDVFLGAGILKARDMLDVTYDMAKSIHGQTLRFPAPGPAKWGDDISDCEADEGVPKDYYDGERGYYAAVIDPVRASQIEGWHRVGLREGSYSLKNKRGGGMENERQLRRPSPSPRRGEAPRSPISARVLSGTTRASI